MSAEKNPQADDAKLDDTPEPSRREVLGKPILYSGYPERTLVSRLMRYSWLDIVMFTAAVVLLIPLVMKFAEVIANSF